MKGVLLLEWKTIHNHQRYEVSNTGKVRKRNGNCLKPYFDKTNRLRVTLDGQTEYIHRLVAVAFVNNPEKKSDVRHKDGNRANNHFWNLEWVSHSDTQKESYGWFGRNAPGGYSEPKPIRIVETGEEFPSIRSCARHIGGTSSGIRQCLDGKIDSYLGFHFERLIF